jgi:16S rRNA (cytosine1402-N4)-methyltransferase
MLLCVRAAWRSRATLRRRASTASFEHVTVLAREATDCLLATPALPPSPAFVDATAGGGGHSRVLLHHPGATVFGVDVDGAAVEAATRALAQGDGRFAVAQGSYVDLPSLLRDAGRPPLCNGLLADLGVSSHQLDEPGRGFSYRADGPLDMRFDGAARSGSAVTAGHLVNALPRAELQRVLSEYGEEPLAFDIAGAITARRTERAFTRTLDLADVVRAVAAASGRRRGWDATATPASVSRVFQALRIAVNGELGAVEALLRLAPALIDPRHGGCIAVITFHSLEDRLVKRAFAALTAAGGRGVGGTWAPVEGGRHAAPSAAEVAANPRARSAKLRAVRYSPAAAAPPARGGR